MQFAKHDPIRFCQSNFLETILQTENSKTGSGIINSLDNKYQIIIINSGEKELLHEKF
ncbi:hypothetical protein CHA01nite_39210 [Chryseobacterium hagamense]|uniref:Uncharacterized protein n=1 Tax=Chryseobacterium hagamense TaxID=395935 RepID=A0A511YSK7_9FLAO|nr:hypothetical protein CHA01nite_39210 [Chryseobacterium hagamense]